MKKTLSKKRNPAKATAKGAARLAKEQKLKDHLDMAAEVYRQRHKEQDEANALRQAAGKANNSNSGSLENAVFFFGL